MARPYRPELQYPAYELGRFFRYQRSALAHLMYPGAASFAKQIANGTIAPAPTPDDPAMEWVGCWYGGLKTIERRVLSFKFDAGLDPKRIARECGCSKSRIDRFMDRLLGELGGYLRGRNDVAKAA
jgi:hypothetical protein